MITDRIYTIGILIFYFLIPSTIFVCFLFLFLDLNADLNQFFTTTISFLLGKFIGLIYSKVINYHQEEQILKLQSELRSIEKSISNPNILQTPTSSTTE